MFGTVLMSATMRATIGLISTVDTGGAYPDVTLLTVQPLPIRNCRQ